MEFIPRKLFVVCRNIEEAEQEEDIWTLSFDENEIGWENDCDQRGYGLKKEIAQIIADAYNEKYGFR